MMAKVKLAIIYYSETGTNYTMGRWAEEAAERFGADVRLRKVPYIKAPHDLETDPAKKRLSEDSQNIPEVSLEDLVWADGILFSTPAKYGMLVAPMKHFFEQTGGIWAEGKLINKVVSAMTSAQNPHGGQEGVLLSLYASMYHWGAIIAAPGYTDPVRFEAGGNPYGTTVTVTEDGNMLVDPEKVRKGVIQQTERTITIAKAIAALKE